MKAKILIVEDDPHILLGLEEVLKSDGFEVAVCNRGDQALGAAGKSKPALILLDVMLPGLSGYDVCKQLRAKKITIPILMLTAKGQEIDKVVGLDLGADDYVTKPFAVKELLAHIPAALDLKCFRINGGRSDLETVFAVIRRERASLADRNTA